MSLKPVTFYATCDVQGCNNDELGTLIELNRGGWQYRSIQEGKVVLVPMGPHSHNWPCVCRECVIEGLEKEMQVAGTT